MAEDKKKTKAENLAGFIILNWHHCPVPDDLIVPDCCGWSHNRHSGEPEYQQCKKCILKNSEYL